MQQVHYRITWRSRTAFPGAHASSQSGGGQEFSHHARLIDAPDVRRLDLHASIKDPFEQWLIRRFRQRSGVSVYVLADLSASMGFAGKLRKLDVLADLVQALAYSAHRSGDRFGFVGCGERVLDDWYLSAGQRGAAGVELAQRLRNFIPEARNADGLLEAPAYLARQRALVFLVSDFHFPLQQLDRLLGQLSAHQVVPVVLWDRAEFETASRWGLARLQDSESRRTRLVLLTPRFAAELARMFDSRRAQLSAQCMRRLVAPLFLLDGFNADQLSAYFHSDSLSAVRAPDEHALATPHG